MYQISSANAPTSLPDNRHSNRTSNPQGKKKTPNSGIPNLENLLKSEDAGKDCEEDIVVKVNPSPYAALSTLKTSSKGNPIPITTSSQVSKTKSTSKECLTQRPSKVNESIANESKDFPGIVSTNSEQYYSKLPTTATRWKQWGGRTFDPNDFVSLVAQNKEYEEEILKLKEKLHITACDNDNLKRNTKEIEKKLAEMEQENKKIMQEQEEENKKFAEQVEWIQAQMERNYKLCAYMEETREKMVSQKVNLEEAKICYSEVEKIILSREMPENEDYCECSGIFQRIIGLLKSAKYSFDMARSMDFTQKIQVMLAELQKEDSDLVKSKQSVLNLSNTSKKSLNEHSIELKLQIEEMEEELETAKKWKERYTELLTKNKNESTKVEDYKNKEENLKILNEKDEQIRNLKLELEKLKDSKTKMQKSYETENSELKNKIKELDEKLKGFQTTEHDSKVLFNILQGVVLLH